MKIVILGGGIAGLLAAYVLRDRKPVLLEAQSKLGGNYAAGGLKYIRQTPEMEQLLAELEIPWTAHRPVGVVHWDRIIHPHPSWLATLDASARQDVQMTHWQKTRGTLTGLRQDCMNDPLGNGADMAMLCDHSELLYKLTYQAGKAGVEVLTNSKISRIFDNKIIDDEHGDISYSHLVTTLPLGVLGKLAPHKAVPFAAATRLTIVTVTAKARPLEWDYAYTPQLQYTSRIVWKDVGVIQFEVPFAPPEFLQEPAMSLSLDIAKVPGLAALVGNTPDVAGIATIPGHLQPLASQPTYPDNWHPLGRFAEWDSRSTAERVLSRAHQIAQSING